MSGGRKLARAFMFAAAAAFVMRTSTAEAAPQRIPVEVWVNGVDRGDAILVVDGGVLELSNDDLKRLGLQKILTPAMLRTTAFVRLLQATGIVKASFDEQSVSLMLTVEPAFLERQLVDLSAGRPADLRYRRTSGAYLNYSLQSRGSMRAFAEGALTSGDAVLHQTVAVRSDGRLVHGLIDLRFDDVSRMRRLTIGDSYIDTGSLGSSVMVTGISFQRDTKLDPYSTLAPSMTVRGAVDAPAAGDIYVNGAFVRRITLQPGTFDIRNVPGLEGINHATVVLHDAFGGVRTLTTEYEDYGELLRAGTNDYAAAVGGVRVGIMTAGDMLAYTAGMARYAVGITDRLTVGGRLESASGRSDAGTWFDTAVSGVRLHAAAAVSRSAYGQGSAWEASARTTSRSMTAGFSVRGQSPQYATASLDARDDRVVRDFNATLGSSIGRGMHAQIDYDTSAMREGDSVRRISSRFDAALGKHVTLFLSLVRSRGAQSGASYFLGLVLPFGRGGSQLISVNGDGPVAQPSVQVQDRSPGLLGVDTNEVLRGGPQPSANGMLDVRTQYANAQVTYDAGNGRPLLADLSVSGGLAVADGRVTFGRPVGESFVVLEAPGIRGGRAYANGQDVGKTNGRGDILVSNTVPNYANRFSIDDDNDRSDQSIQTAEATVAPPVHGGAVVRFAVQRLRALRGRLVLVTGHGETVPAYGRLELHRDGTTVNSELGENGEFYFDDLAPGTYRADVVYRGGRCTAPFSSPSRTSVSTNMGIVRFAC